MQLVEDPYSFKWGKYQFVWIASIKHFESKDTNDFVATIEADGTNWACLLKIAGGGLTRKGKTPIEALNVALKSWREKVETIEAGITSNAKP